MKIVETYEDNGHDIDVWKCPICGWETSTYAGGEPCECMGCLAREAEEQNIEGV